MKSANTFRALMVLTLTLQTAGAYAGMSTFRSQTTDEQQALDSRIKEYDSKIANEDANGKALAKSVSNLTNEVEEKRNDRKYVTGQYGKGKHAYGKFKCTDQDHYDKDQCTRKPVITGYDQFGIPQTSNPYYDSKECADYRFCMEQYKDAQIDDDSISAVYDQISSAQTDLDTSNGRLEQLQADRGTLLKAAGYEYRAPRDISELSGSQSMQFKDTLTLDPTTNGTAVKITNDGCTVTLSPFDTDDLSWSTGGANKPYVWDFKHMNFESQEIKTVEGCASESVHPWRLKECTIAVKMDGRYINPPSVVLESKAYPGKYLSFDADTKKQVLTCLTNRGFDAGTILAKATAAPTTEAKLQGGAANH